MSVFLVCKMGIKLSQGCFLKSWNENTQLQWSAHTIQQMLGAIPGKGLSNNFFSNADKEDSESFIFRLYKTLSLHQSSREHELDVTWPLLKDIKR